MDKKRIKQLRLEWGCRAWLASPGLWNGHWRLSLHIRASIHILLEQYILGILSPHCSTLKVVFTRHFFVNFSMKVIKKYDYICLINNILITLCKNNPDTFHRSAWAWYSDFEDSTALALKRDSAKMPITPRLTAIKHNYGRKRWIIWLGPE